MQQKELNASSKNVCSSIAQLDPIVKGCGLECASKIEASFSPLWPRTLYQFQAVCLSRFRSSKMTNDTENVSNNDRGENLRIASRSVQRRDLDENSRTRSVIIIRSLVESAISLRHLRGAPDSCALMPFFFLSRSDAIGLSPSEKSRTLPQYQVRKT